MRRYCIGSIHSKVAIYLPTYPTTMNILGESNSINSMYMPRSEFFFFFFWLILTRILITDIVNYYNLAV